MGVKINDLQQNIHAKYANWTKKKMQYVTKINILKQSIIRFEHEKEKAVERIRLNLKEEQTDQVLKMLELRVDKEKELKKVKDLSVISQKNNYEIIQRMKKKKIKMMNCDYVSKLRMQK